MERVKIITPKTGCLWTKCYIGEKELYNISSVDLHAEAGMVPAFTFETIGSPEIDIPGDVHFHFTPETLQEAATVIRHECSDKKSVTYKAFVDSAAGALKELPEGTGLYDVAEAVVNRILGLEDADHGK